MHHRGLEIQVYLILYASTLFSDVGSELEKCLGRLKVVACAKMYWRSRQKLFGELLYSCIFVSLKYFQLRNISRVLEVDIIQDM